MERLTRHLVFRRILPAAFSRAPLYVSPSVGLKYLFKRMDAVDPLLLRSSMLVRSGDVVWDVGANVGLFSVAAAACAGRAGQVIAFEPDTWLVSLLRRTAQTHQADCAKITVVPAAIGSGIALRSFQIALRSRASSTLAGYGQSQMGGVAEEHIVPAFNLDWLLDHLPTPRVLKIDVEGAELEVLIGQMRMLREVRPAIICEVASAASREIAALLINAGYVLYDGEKTAEGALPTAHACWSTIALPKERAPEELICSAQIG
jgi:FkbM family methyltransferase